MRFHIFIILSILTLLFLLCVMLVGNADETQVSELVSPAGQHYSICDKNINSNNYIMSQVALSNASPSRYEIQTPSGTISCIVSPTTGSVPLTVHFIDTSTVNESFTKWAYWYYRDSSFYGDSNLKNATYTYRFPGTYNGSFNVFYRNESGQFTNSQINFTIDVKQNFYVNSTKMVGGWPFLRNDQYNTLGVEITGTYNDDISEWIFLEAVDLSSLRKSGSTDKTYAIKSQSIKLNGISALHIISTNLTGVTEWAWPYSGPDSEMMRQHPDSFLLTSTINATRENMTFPLNSTVLNESMAGGSDGSDAKKRGTRKEKPLTQWDWTYTTCPWGNVSDSAASVWWTILLEPGSTVEFDVIGDTQWGLFDYSQSTVHVKIIVPSDINDGMIIQMS